MDVKTVIFYDFDIWSVHPLSGDALPIGDHAAGNWHIWITGWAGYRSYDFWYAHFDAVISQLFHLVARRVVQSGARGWCRVLGYLFPHYGAHVFANFYGCRDSSGDRHLE